MVEELSARGKFNFRYSVMNAGKSWEVLQTNYNYKKAGKKVQIIVPSKDVRFGPGVVTVKMDGEKNMTHPATAMNKINAEEIVKKWPDLQVLILDEVQFFSKSDIYQLSELVDRYNITVMAYGLLKTSDNELWPASAELIRWADSMEECKTISPISGCKATCVVRQDTNGNYVYHPENMIELGDSQYTSVTRAEWKERVLYPVLEKNRQRRRAQLALSRQK